MIEAPAIKSIDDACEFIALLTKLERRLYSVDEIN